MSIFGKLDAANIPTNAFFVEAGEYEAEVTKAEYRTGRDNNRQLSIVFTITNEDSQYNGSVITKFFNLVDPEMTLEAFALLPVQEQKDIRRSNAELKKTLCGNGRHKGLGVEVDDLNDENWNPEVLKGTKVNLAVKNFGTDGVNLAWANIQE